MAKQVKSYNESIAEIQEIMVQIENQQLDVDELTQKVQRAAELLKICKDKLQKTDVEVQKIMDEMGG
ncbi:MAG: exodeoxyribonuclease VII small subunit [Paludibacteraceae bacterium]|nr:exodeoxyribonuclease VII small subunit [Paludibacteraceae bacterium]MBN2787237.1 exodeoxyribonuclease VII small subunit [Paludibacteraceae bacterium]